MYFCSVKWHKHEHTELELLMQLLQGNEDAFTHIYHRFWPVLYAVAQRYLKDDEMAKDAVQHVFMQLWECKSELALDTHLKNLLFTMTKNHLINIIRHNNMVIQKNYEWAQMSESNETWLEKMQGEGKLQQLEQAIETLPEQKNRILHYKLDEHLSNQQIAEVMGLSIQTVKNQYTSALKLLRERLIDNFSQSHLFNRCNTCVLHRISSIESQING